MKKSLSKILARMAKDGDPEEVAELFSLLIEPDQAASETPAEPAAASPAAAAEKAIGEMSMDEFLAGFSEMMSDSDHAPKTTAAPEGGAYVGRHEAGAGRRAPAASAGGWYQPGRPEAPDEKTDA